MAVMGAPKKAFDVAQFEAMCYIQCTEQEIAAVLGVSVDTVERRVQEHYGGRTFADVYAEKRAGGKASLRRAQWKKAIESGDTIMQIFLGKNILGQTDKQELHLQADLDVTVTAAALQERARLLLTDVSEGDDD